ncbi:NB-ARC domain-containing protein [Streptomyces sp. NPDC059008]|uniref:NB-ARC domain-containing protein n=1 Tax=Streptomyces sp. NPDC059008 TaxID=3346693 RepID=UPI0036835E9C
MDPASVIASIAMRLAGQLIGARLKVLVFGPPERAALRKITARVLRCVLESHLTAGASGDRAADIDRAQHVDTALGRLFTAPEVSDLIVGAALENRADPVDGIVDLALGMGLDARSLGVDLPSFLGDFVGQLGKAIRDDARRPSSPLFNRVVVSALEGERAGGTAVEQVQGLAPPPPQLFVGREADQEALRQRLIPMPDDASAPRLQVVTAVHGLPGVGKTSMAATLAHDTEIGRAFPHGVLWTSLESKDRGRDKIRTSLGQWVRVLDEEPDPAWPPQFLTARLSAILRDRRMLLIVDDVVEPGEASPFMVGGVHCAHVVTTRQPANARALATAHHQVYPLKVLSPQASFELVARLAKDVARRHPQELRVLVDRLDGLPLVLRVAANMLQAKLDAGQSAEALIATLDQDERLWSQSPPPALAGLVNETSPTIAAVFYRSVTVLDHVTKLRFAYLGAFGSAAAPITLDHAQRVWDAIPGTTQTTQPPPAATVYELVERGLLETVGPQTYKMHSVLARYATWLLETL